jgi:hypothetical protein
MDCTNKRNFPSKRRYFYYHSPRTIMHQKSMISIIGTYVQAHNEPNFKNSQQPRAIACIYLRYIDDIQDRHHLLDLRLFYT